MITVTMEETWSVSLSGLEENCMRSQNLTVAEVSAVLTSSTPWDGARQKRHRFKTSQFRGNVLVFKAISSTFLIYILEEKQLVK